MLYDSLQFGFHLRECPISGARDIPLDVFELFLMHLGVDEVVIERFHEFLVLHVP